MASIPVVVNLVDGTSTTTTLVARDPAEWTPEDARRFVWEVWRLLLATGGDSLQLLEEESLRTYRLEFVADTGSAVTGSLGLSDAALEWLQTATFRLPIGDTTH